MNKLIRIGAVCGFHHLGVPNQFLTGAVGDIAQMIRFSQPTRILKIASRWIASFTSVNPFGMMPA